MQELFFPPLLEEGGGALQEASRKQNKTKTALSKAPRSAACRPSIHSPPGAARPALDARFTAISSIGGPVLVPVGRMHRGIPGRAPVRQTETRRGRRPPFPCTPVDTVPPRRAAIHIVKRVFGTGIT